VPDADGQERADSYDNTSKIHFRADYLFIWCAKVAIIHRISSTNPVVLIDFR